MTQRSVSIRARIATAAATALVIIGAAGPALADCYDLVGCSDKDAFSRHFGYLASVSDGPNCDFLWMMRNRIYAEHGYCFATARGKSEIGNQGCRYNDMAAVPLSAIERSNVATVARAERLKNCPR
jgi:hypothetical protein